MRIVIAAIGRARKGPELALFDHYAARITRWPLDLRQLEVPGSRPPAERREAEAKLLIAAADGATAVALDEAAPTLTSADFAARLGRWQDDGTAAVAFLIGGADGHTATVRDRAAASLSFGAMTWPHLLVRGLLAEQLYRAQQILAGHPYHRA